ncbi:MAG: SH3 domain-containing protein [Rickettsiales bacterium]|nr:SH3 domain-containing protein [Rickettsiales bacterium]
MKNIITALLCWILLLTNNLFAAPQIHEVNYFASLRSSKTNVRAGPGLSYPIKFTFQKTGLPVHVISEYDNWSEVRDYEGQTGWIANSLITKRRTLLIRTDKDFINMHKKQNQKSSILYRLENNVVGYYIKCLDDWCALEVENKRGWVKRDNVFGI